MHADAALLAAGGAGIVPVCWWWRRGRRGAEHGDQLRGRLPSSWSWLPVIAAALIGAWCGLHGWSWRLLADVVFAGGAVVLAWIDADVQRIPNRFMVWWGPLTLIVAAGAAGLMAGLRGAGFVVAAVVLAGAAYLLVGLVGSLGGGDIKLAAVTAGAVAVHGLDAILVWLWATALLGAACAVVAIVKTRNRRTLFPFGPALAVAGILAIAANCH